MKYRFLIVILCVASLLISSVSTAEPSLCQFGKETLSSVTCYGPTTLAETTVNGKVTVTGPLSATQVNIHTMDITGVTTLNHSTIKANVAATGQFNANLSNFTGNLVIASEQIVLTHSSIKGSLTVKANRNNPVVELRCKTTINGDIIFEGKSGVIKKSADSVVEGKVVNGVMEALGGEEC